jgi:hypothetical protein
LRVSWTHREGTFITSASISRAVHLLAIASDDVHERHREHVRGVRAEAGEQDPRGQRHGGGGRPSTWNETLLYAKNIVLWPLIAPPAR